jgi:hypothetical protein
MQSAVVKKKEPNEDKNPSGHLGLPRDTGSGTRYSPAARGPELFSALWLGLPGDPDAGALARKLERLNGLDELTRRRIRKELRECLDDMLGDEADAAVA